MVIKAKNPAGVAEKYIIESIWNGQYPSGSILPSERELSEQIGITRTTLREVLQRLARDGWLTIQHGKATRVNYFMETSGLHILDTLMALDKDNAMVIVDDLLAARTSIAPIFMRYAFCNNPEDCKKLLAHVIKAYQNLLDAESWDSFLSSSSDSDLIKSNVSNDTSDELDRESSLRARTFNFYDFFLFQQLAFHSGNQIYGFMFNGLRKVYNRVGNFYFSHEKSPKEALIFYKKLNELLEEGKLSSLTSVIRNYGRVSGLIWQEMKNRLPQDFTSREVV